MFKPIITEEEKARVEVIFENQNEEDFDALTHFGADMYNKGLYDSAIGILITTAVTASIYICNRLFRKH